MPEIDPSVTVTYTEITPSVTATYTEITHTGDTWTEIIPQEYQMGSAYTDNNKFEKIGTGEQAGTWGTTTNLNFDMIDRAINGVKTITLTGSSSS